MQRLSQALESNPDALNLPMNQIVGENEQENDFISRVTNLMSLTELMALV